MKEKISINQVEQLTGVSKRNIRFYEKEGLLIPERNTLNGYRTYGESDVQRVKVIKMLRMLDMPIEEIKRILDGKISLEEAILEHQNRLEEKMQEVQIAIQFCSHLKTQEIQTLNVDQCLEKMEQTGAASLFTSWINDYKKIVAANKDRDFTFMPDGAVTNSREFTDALCEYAAKEGLEIFITKESMYPEFTLNGVEYTAERYYTSMGRVPVAYVHCARVDREVNGDGVEKKRKNILWFLHKYWIIPIIVIFDLIVIWKWYVTLYSSWEEWVIPIALIGMQIGGLYYNYLFHYNEKT